MKKTWFVIPALIAAAGACGSVLDPLVCPAIATPSVVVTVVDSLTSANVTPGSTVVLRDQAGAVVDSVDAPNSVITVVGVGKSRTGTFTLTVRKPGYQTWTKSGIEVEKGTCGAETVDVTAKLQPAG